MKQPVYLVCGVPGSGKTWVCEQLKDKFTYVPHDKHYKDHLGAIEKAMATSLKPIITECPFAERILREKLEAKGIKVLPYFVVENAKTVASRYAQREKKIIPKGNLTRLNSIPARAIAWMSPMGTSSEILKLLQTM